MTLKKILESLEHIPPEILKKNLKGVLWEGTPDSGGLSLTFDDGPDPDITPYVLDFLDEAGARGTFFMVGEQVKKHPDTARMVVERGHIAGNHSMTHCSMFLMKKSEVNREIDDTQKAISDTTGAAPCWFRPPYGMFDFTSAEAVRQKGLTLVLWTVLSGDYSDDPPEKILRTVEPFIRPGAILVFHDTAHGGGLFLPEILRSIYTRARHDEIRFIGIDELTVSDSIEGDENDA
ncbi:polysaccharide deacetylase family protein [bacterium]|nr:polysaccharide deacetylase family protein [bacterium]